MDLVGNDVVLGAAMNGANRDDARVIWIVLTRNDRLPTQDGACRYDDRVDTILRRCSVRAAAVNGDIYRIRVGQCISRSEANLSGRQSRRIVHRDGKVRPRKTGEQA